MRILSEVAEVSVRSPLLCTHKAWGDQADIQENVRESLFCFPVYYGSICISAKGSKIFVIIPWKEQDGV